MHAATGLSEEQARARSTVSQLSVGGLIKHVTRVEERWVKGMRWSARRALLHILAETSQHAGHADIVREAIDGQKTMG